MDRKLKAAPSIRSRCCEWCGSTKDLVECETGGYRLLTCENAKECESRWPDQWEPGTIGTPQQGESDG